MERLLDENLGVERFEAGKRPTGLTRARAFQGATLIVLLVCGSSGGLRADEGLWPFNRLPVDLLEKRYGFAPDTSWAEHVMRSSVRLSSGGSGGLVSPEGLVMTNHHVISSCVHELSTPERNLVEEGFFARSREEELRCPGVEVLVLQEIEDVTDRIKGAAPGELDPGAREKARRAEIARVEAQSKEATGLHSEVVTLYRGGEYHLYRYRRYDDVRLVMVPEVDIAFFGGDADNFEYPRYCLDVGFVRLYEDGDPASVTDYLRWGEEALEEGDPVFVSGNPGSTQRQNTVAHLRYLRDHRYPAILELLYRREIALEQFALEGPEAERVAKDDLFSVQNGRKAVRGILAGLLQPEILREKMRAEAALQARVAAGEGLGAGMEDWRRIAGTLEAYERFDEELVFLEVGWAFWSDLFRHARTIVRLVEEREKPEAERLPEYRDALLPRVEMRLYSTAPIARELEVAKLTDSLTHLAETFGAEHSLVRLILAGQSPAERAYELVSGSGLDDAAQRKELVEGGREAVEASDDPMIRLARLVDPFARAVNEKHETLVEAVTKEAYGNLAAARFAITGTGVYPDATFTPRLSFGVVKGWEEQGETIEPFTRMAGAYRLAEIHDGAEPYELPESWKKRRGDIDGSTHFNFVSTADIIGGNSGSPVIDRQGRIVGLIFDGNIHGLVLDISYTETKARAIAVSARAIVEALEEIYGMEGLVNEITGR